MKLTGKTTDELLAMAKAIEEDPTNQERPGNLFLYTKSARKKLDAIREQITHNMAMKRAAEGRPVVSDGYSGRRSNRRR